MSHPFTVYHASAGSGKTYALVREYLEKCLIEGNPQNAFYGILAITFTNKAASEMKSRVIEYLQDFASKNPKHVDLMKDLGKRIGQPQDELIRRSKDLLSGILHEYDRFSISTIDKFNSRIIRTFALDLDLPLNYEVEIDSDRLIEEAVDRLLLKIGEDEQVTSLLKSYSDQQMENDQDWRIEKGLIQKGKLLFQERDRIHLDSLAKENPTEFLKSIKALQKHRRELQKEAQEVALELLNLIESAGHEIKFSAGNFPKWLKKMADKRNWSSTKEFLEDPEGEVVPKAQYLKRALEGDFLNKKPLPQDEAWVEEHEEQLAGGTAQILSCIEQDIPLFLYTQNMYEVAALSMLDQCLTELKEERNVVHISEFNRTIANQVRNEPVLFIYERLGNRYKHYFVDEFQDTSRMQWSNLLPLIHEVLSSGGSCLVVGDGKQAIYRWRGGDVQLFLDLTAGLNPVYESGLGPQVIPEPPKPEGLIDNWRSRKEIVAFNNQLYTQASSSLREELFQKLYSESAQNPRGKEGGYLVLHQFSESLKADRELQARVWINEHITEVIARGGRYEDIAILVRNNKEASPLAQYLQVEGGPEGKGIPVVSNESLLLSTSPEVNVLVQFLRWKAESNAVDAASRILLYLAHTSKLELESQHRDFQRALKEDQFEEVLREWMPLWNAGEWQQRTLYEKVQTLTSWIPHFDRSNAYVQFFLDLCHQYSLKKQGTEQEFLEWWDDTREKHSITVPEGLNAVQILTIHKAKGLEFSVVMIPFADWGTKMDKEWFDLTESEVERYGLKKVLVNLTKKAALGKHPLNELKLASEEAQILDVLNTLYVGTTRAVDELYIGFAGEGKQNTNAVNQYFVPFMESEEPSKTGSLGESWEIGEKVSWNHDELQTSEFLTARKTGEWREKLRVSFESNKHWDTRTEARHYGTQVHRVLQEINYPEDVPRALNSLERSGILKREDRTEIGAEIKRMLQYPGVAKYFDPKDEIRNEAPIILPGGSTQRPDRLVFHEPDEVSIIDFKTGSPDQKHRDQVDAYTHLLNLAHVNVVNRALIYLNPILLDENW